MSNANAPAFSTLPQDFEQRKGGTAAQSPLVPLEMGFSIAPWSEGERLAVQLAVATDERLSSTAARWFWRLFLHCLRERTWRIRTEDLGTAIHRKRATAFRCFAQLHACGYIDRDGDFLSILPLFRKGPVSEMRPANLKNETDALTDIGRGQDLPRGAEENFQKTFAAAPPADATDPSSEQPADAAADPSPEQAGPQNAEYETQSVEVNKAVIGELIAWGVMRHIAIRCLKARGLKVVQQELGYAKQILRRGSITNPAAFIVKAIANPGCYRPPRSRSSSPAPTPPPPIPSQPCVRCGNTGKVDPYSYCSCPAAQRLRRAHGR